MYPLKFRPIYKQRIWGGQKLREVFGKDIPAGEKIGESWELTDLPEDKSVIANGELAGETIASAIKKYPREIMGDSAFSGPFPLLIKFLDAEDVLSLQVHPDAETCKRMGKGMPKTECWYIISARPGAVIYKGLKKGVDRERFARAIRAGQAAELFHKAAVKAGECHYLPAGTAHAIGAGILIAEIQTPSDTTYRVYDWDRVDESGKPRPLHIDEALESIHFGASADKLLVTTTDTLLDSEHFKIDKFEISPGDRHIISRGQMRVFIIIKGAGKFSGDETVVDFKAGDTLLMPAACHVTVRIANDTEFLVVSVLLL
jgi:mannose-6-phosphate isomerase